MPRFDDDRPQGVIPACLLPFKDDLSIDEAAYRKHLRDVVSVPGLSAITINAHASEVASCTFDEQKRVLDITMDEVGDGIAVVDAATLDYMGIIQPPGIISSGHHIQTDSKGNIYIAATPLGMQRLLFKGTAH